MSAAMDDQHDTDARRVRVWALTQALRAHGYDVEVAESEPLLVVPVPAGSPVQVRCEYRAECGGEPWFRFADGAAIAPAGGHHLQDAVVAIKGEVASRTDRHAPPPGPVPPAAGRRAPSWHGL